MSHSVNDGFPYYINLVGSQDYKELFHSKQMIGLLRPLSEEKGGYRYATGKWSIKQIVGHVIDHERIMTYRALRFSRKDKTPLPGYDQDLYVANSRFDEQSLAELLDDFEALRNSTITFMRSMSPAQLLLTGTAWKYELTVEDFLKATIGHELHHLAVLKERYLL